MLQKKCICEVILKDAEGRGRGEVKIYIICAEYKDVKLHLLFVIFLFSLMGLKNGIEEKIKDDRCEFLRGFDLLLPPP